MTGISNYPVREITTKHILGAALEVNGMPLAYEGSSVTQHRRSTTIRTRGREKGEWEAVTVPHTYRGGTVSQIVVIRRPQ